MLSAREGQDGRTSPTSSPTPKIHSARQPSPPPRMSAPVRTSRSPSPQAQQRLAMSSLDQRHILELSHTCMEELDVKTREKAALTKLLAELKKKKMSLDNRISKKKKEFDSTVVQTMEMEKKYQMVTNGNKMMTAELGGLRSENEKLESIVENIKRDFAETTAAFEKETHEVEKLKRMLFTYRKEITAEGKQKDNVQQDLRASKTARDLMINRLDDMYKRNRALKRCVVDTFNTFN
eukprot:gnl/TRDRNA2_/TRDRNA2_52464_c0_seq1.p1 gnl/TRDRNA2_/TRDRNA2_52464_c0~~gnl/TRDRNA2_/TRDRNA2_52464_c0_seq1.p1  ORF type:complete len:236 (+),score=68.37 gnl/TRDRNA2_/TRDRNA2_52464_c0_seq1:136-843(+)